MERMRWLPGFLSASLLLTPAWLFLPCPAHAQTVAASPIEFPREVYARVGSGKLYDDEGSLGKGLSGAGGFAWQVSPRWGFGVELASMGNERTGFVGARGFIEGDGIIGTGSVHLYLFPDSRHQLYVSGGLGVLHYRRTQLLPDLTIDGEPVDVFRDDTETKVGWRGAVGVRFSLHPRWTLRFEGSLFAAETEIVEAPFTWLQASVGVGFRF